MRPIRIMLLMTLLLLLLPFGRTPAPLSSTAQPALQDSPLARCRAENATLAREIRVLKGRADSLQGRVAELEREREAMISRQRDITIGVESANRDLADLRRIRGELEGRLADCSRQNESIVLNNTTLSQRVEEAEVRSEQSRLELQRERDASLAARRELLTRVPMMTEEARRNPRILLESIKLSQQALDQSEATTGSCSFERDGQVHVVKNLVIGTLDTTYAKDVAPGDHFQLKAVFRAHPVIRPVRAPGSTEDLVTWLVKLDFSSFQIETQYNMRHSGNKLPQREMVSEAAEETWVWDLTAPGGFKGMQSDLIVYAGYRKEGEEPLTDLVRESIVVEARYVPGFFERLLAFFASLTVLLASLSGGLALATGYFAYRKARLESENADLKRERAE